MDVVQHTALAWPEYTFTTAGCSAANRDPLRVFMKFIRRRLTRLVDERHTHLSAQGSPTQVSTAHTDNVFTVLAQQAAGRTRAELWTTTVGGSINSILVWWQYPSIWWLGAGFLAVAAYGVWGLADHAITERLSESRHHSIKSDLIAAAHKLAVPVGVVSAILAVGGFMGAALGGWNH